MVETIFCSRYTSFYFISCPLPSLLIPQLCLFSLRRPFPPALATTPNDLFRLHHQRISKTWTVKCFYAGKYESRIRSISPSDDPFLSLSLVLSSTLAVDSLGTFFPLFRFHWKELPRRADTTRSTHKPRRRHRRPQRTNDDRFWKAGER